MAAACQWLADHSPDIAIRLPARPQPFTMHFYVDYRTVGRGGSLVKCKAGAIRARRLFTICGLALVRIAALGQGI